MMLGIKQHSDVPPCNIKEQHLEKTNNKSKSMANYSGYYSLCETMSKWRIYVSVTYLATNTCSTDLTLTEWG